ncbi:MAG: RNA recognition motif domain-containing protein [Gammaproteobacteria bacterium]
MSWDNIQFQTIYGIMAAVLGAWLILGLVLYFKQDNALKQLKAATDAQLAQTKLLQQMLGAIQAFATHWGIPIAQASEFTNHMNALNNSSDFSNFNDSSDNAYSNGSSNAESSSKIYVGNVDYRATEDELASLFSQFGQIEFVNIPIDKYTGRARGYGFVSFTSNKEAQRAVELNGTEFRGRSLQVSFAKEKA